MVLLPWVPRTKLLLAGIFLGGAYLARNGGWCFLPSRAAAWACLLMRCLHRLPVCQARGCMACCLRCFRRGPRRRSKRLHPMTSRSSLPASHPRRSTSSGTSRSTALPGPHFFLVCLLGLVCRGNFRGSAGVPLRWNILQFENTGLRVSLFQVLHLRKEELHNIRHLLSK